MASQRSTCRRRRDDDGYVMLTVIGMMLVLSVLVTLTLGWTVQATKSGRNVQDHSAALAAAEAGADDYIARLNANPTYYSSSTALTTASATLPGGGSYTWRVLNSATDIQTSGRITLQSVGTVKGDSRKITMSLGKPGFLDYLYFTQYETIDPIATGQAAGTCSLYRYPYPTATSPVRDTSPTVCPDIQFRTGDNLKGNVYSKDAIVLSGSPNFTARFDTGWSGDSTGKKWVDANGSGSTPGFAVTPTTATYPFPTTNSSLRTQAAKSNGGGCLYKGPTRILFKQNGTMDVTSPYSGSTNPGCGTFSPSAPTVSGLQVPANNVIFVDNYTGNPTNCANPAGVGGLVGFPIANDDALTRGNSKLVYGCGNGDAFVEGWLKGQVTVGTANNIIVTGDLRYAGNNGSAVGTGVPSNGTSSPNVNDTSGLDVLGLSAANFVEVYHPIHCSGWDGNNNCTGGTEVSSAPYPKANFQIDAVIVASQDSFIVQNWKFGSPQNALTVLGGIVQLFRGPVGTSSNNVVASGYLKNYNYDSRLQYNPPPFLADLASTAWAKKSWAESKP